MPRDDFDRATIAAGLRTEALVPLVWNDAPIGLLSMGATSDANALRLSERLGTLAEFAFISAAVLGPTLTERWDRDLLQSEILMGHRLGVLPLGFQLIVNLVDGQAGGLRGPTRFSYGTRPDLRFLGGRQGGNDGPAGDGLPQHAGRARARQLPQGSFRGAWPTSRRRWRSA